MLLKGTPVAERVLEKIKQEIANSSTPPGLAVVLIGNDPASEVYVGMKVKKAADLGMVSKAHRLPSDATLTDILKLIERLNHDPTIHGILVQIPLPKHLDSNAIIQAISPEKDVDGLHPINMGKLLLGQLVGFAPCTPAGIIELLHYYEIPLLGRHVAVVGRSNIVGKPLAAMLMQKHPSTNATVTLLHSQSQNLTEILKTADIIIAAVGVPLFIKESMVSSNTVIIDVGTSRVTANNAKGYTLVGDVDFNNVVTKCKAISPVPGGVGPMTVAMLMKNTWESYQKFSS
ncbi:bifunctional methylenetetrahydrofolate dehydrogenase/methenyltetrahydrofolate cyclohydrolase FolD [Chlamydia psittaci]|uniref:bifunctional methylenetetrahydrofolate dehydrogenase/methenyltetrahydrofolate cyclohydrolase FolD n=1 Tax=Chlamydia psittaci TaxID=83554 RepID=UPI00027E2086|nr:bifunctional methylenetetrahydrofolate dehydrogenase/methenyltetrahydrofolate cyclohydrolase FolD [Chlamydia psittaci]AFS21493.1 tetrahydrofolate dehydrogenase/cyclohydrolase, catalytic domain protein [Chlamydia psittaci MN]KPZ39506.1 methenyltetrahydrofolate cyclohydrolase [Chlamydia psittaci str. Frances]MBE3636337.1 bifunctional methylenetetrahydrofolate dehydrogenase/methenyltetrahydrofolate cyclohydrolase FolD [Chlamydia psittaci]CCO01955.1 putative hydrolase [Chlamydia psittaci 01DC12]